MSVSFLHQNVSSDSTTGDGKRIGEPNISATSWLQGTYLVLFVIGIIAIVAILGTIICLFKRRRKSQEMHQAAKSMSARLFCESPPPDHDPFDIFEPRDEDKKDWKRESVRQLLATRQAQLQMGSGQGPGSGSGLEPAVQFSPTQAQLESTESGTEDSSRNPRSHK